MTTNLEAAAERLASDESITDRVSLATAALDAIDPRLKLLTPEDTTAILDYMTWVGEGTEPHAFHTIPQHAWEVLS